MAAVAMICDGWVLTTMTIIGTFACLIAGLFLIGGVAYDIRQHHRRRQEGRA